MSDKQYQCLVIFAARLVYYNQISQSRQRTIDVDIVEVAGIEPASENVSV